MSKAKRNFWVVRPKSLISLIGAEYELLRQAGDTVLVKFYLASLMIVFIGLISIFSIVYLVELMFHNRVAEVILSGAVTGLFILMYVFLILTISKKIEGRRFFSFSNITRIGFIIFMAIMISKPIEVYIFRKSVQEKLGVYKENIKTYHALNIQSLFSPEIAALESKMQFYQSNNNNKSFDVEIRNSEGRILALIEKQGQLITAANFKIDRADYIIQQIRLLHSSHKITWAITALTVFLFLLPGYLIYSISRDNTYYPVKEEYERKIVSKEYEAFTKKYSEFFLKKYGMVREVYTKYEDPPFNTKLKPPIQYESSDKFFERYA